jgi:hypothetical protein
MSTLGWRTWRAGLLGLVVVVLAFVGRGKLPARPDEAAPPREYTTSFACNKCHTDSFGDSTELVKLDEFFVWRVKDKHSQAYAVLLSERGKRMGELLGVKGGVTAPEAGCLGCHSLDTRTPGKPETEIQKVLLSEGVGCEACHGASGQWVFVHSEKTWRDKTPEEKQKLGLRDLRNPHVRGQLCESCHIGNAREGKVVTHAMYAAGHPPLPSFEVAAFSEYMPRHWYHTREIPWLKTAEAKGGPTAKQRKNFYADQAPFQQTHMGLVGAVSALQTSAHLLQERATPTPAFSVSRWPELLSVEPAWKADPEQVLGRKWGYVAMTHFDCAACHHDLNVPSWRRLRGYKAAPGRPTPPEWLRTLLPFAIAQVKGASLDKPLADFDAACTKEPFGKPAAIRAATPEVIAGCNAIQAALEKQTVTRVDAEKLLLELCAAGANPGKDGPQTNGRIRDYDSARQLVALIDTIYRELSAPPAKEGAAGKEIAAKLEELKKTLNLVRDTQFEAREKLVRDTVAAIADPTLKDFKDFKERLRRAVARNRLNEELATGDNLRKLSELNEKAQDLTAQRLANYSPTAVQKTLGEILALLKKAAK